MGLTKTEINLRRLLAAAPQQQNQNKLIHYVATLREQVEQLGEERTPEGLPRVSKAKLNDYSEKIEAIASKLATASFSNVQDSLEPIPGTSFKENLKLEEETLVPTSPGLRRRHVSAFNVEDRNQDTTVADPQVSVKLDAAAQICTLKSTVYALKPESIISPSELKLKWTESLEKDLLPALKLQEDLTEEMVGLAQQLKESSLMMSQSLKNTEKVLDSTEKAVEHSLASTGHANTRTMEASSKTWKTTRYMWLLMFIMTFIFVMVVLLIRIT